jgi:hypothetical protein
VDAAFLAPFVVLPNIGLAAFNVTLSTTANMANMATNAAGNAPLADFVGNFSAKVADRTLAAATESGDIALASVQRAIGLGSNRNVNALLASTVLEKGTKTAVLPLWVVWDGAIAALHVAAIQQVTQATGSLVSRILDTWSKPGVIPGVVGADTSARERWAFSDMIVEGPIGAVAADFRGMVGGLLALGFGDLRWLANGARQFHGSMQYVYEKKLHGEVQPESDFPIGPQLAKYATTILEQFPEAFVQALESEDPWQVIQSYLWEPGKVNTLFGTYPLATFWVLFDVAVFVMQALFDVADAQKYALCELAIMDSALSNAEKDSALAALRQTAPKTVVEFEYYVPLLIPLGGTVVDKTHRRNAAGEIIDDQTTSPSVFNPKAIDIAQSVGSELFSLRAMLWLYGDEQMAREKNHRETVRKYGPEVAQRIADQPRYPLTPEQVAKLTQSGLRTQAEIEAIWNELLRERNLHDIAESISGQRLCA